jgi:hypothetical protein
MANCTDAANGSVVDAGDESAVSHALGYGVDRQMAETFVLDGGDAAETAFVEASSMTATLLWLLAAIAVADSTVERASRIVAMARDIGRSPGISWSRLALPEFARPTSSALGVYADL